MTTSMPLSLAARCSLSGRSEVALIRELFASRELGTPVLLVSRGEIRRRYDRLKAALPRVGIHYAVKSNNHPVFIEEIRCCGGNFDICSVGELRDVLTTGIDPATLIHSHPVKSFGEFDQAVAAGVRTFVVDNMEEVHKLERYRDRDLRILIRFRIPTETTAVVNLQYKFGCTVEEVLPLAERIRQTGHSVHGLAFHIGSQCIYVDNYLKAISAAGELIPVLRERGFPVRLLDIGGGFPVQYVEPVPSIEELGAPINRALDEQIAPDIHVVCEPGRYISASPVTLICSVIGKAERDGKVWYYLDDGLYSTFSGIVYDHCRYPVICDGHGDEKLSVLAGPTCDSFDVMYDGVMLPELQVGELVAFPMTGAYCSVSGSHFNSLKRPEYRIISD